MKHIYEKFTNGRYSLAHVTFYTELFNKNLGDTDKIGKERKTLKAARNDFDRYLKNHKDADIYLCADAELITYNADGSVHYSTTDFARIGTSLEGEYYDMCEQRDWL